MKQRTLFFLGYFNVNKGYVSFVKSHFFFFIFAICDYHQEGLIGINPSLIFDQLFLNAFKIVILTDRNHFQDHFACLL